jgi:hypothetical protein
MNCEPCFPELVPRIRYALTKALAAGILEDMSETVVNYLVTGCAPYSHCGHLSDHAPCRFASDILFFQLGYYKPHYEHNVARYRMCDSLKLLEDSLPHEP